MKLKEEKATDPEKEWSKRQIEIIHRYLNGLDLSDPRNRNKINSAYIYIVRGPVG